MYSTCGNSAHYIAEISYSLSFMRYLAALNKDCSRFHSLREQTPFSALIKIFYLLFNFFWQAPARPPFRGHFPWSWGRPRNRGSSVIDKMNFYCIRGIPDPLPWLISDLAHREQYDMVHHHVSSFNNVVCGVPQSSLLLTSPFPLSSISLMFFTLQVTCHLSFLRMILIYLYVIKTWLLKQILIKSSFLFRLGLMQINSLSTLKSLRSLFLFIFSTAQTDYPIRINIFFNNYAKKYPIKINNSPIVRVQKAYFLETWLGNFTSLLSTIV